MTGIVTLDDQPLANASITFSPADTRASTGFTDSEGRYELMFNADLEGAAVGEHQVIISTRSDPETHPELGNQETLPARYNDATTLTEQVKAGENEINFALTSEGAPDLEGGAIP